VLTTPIDAHLPLVIALVLVCAWVARGTRWAAAVTCAVPLLIVAMMTLVDERTRLLAYGVIVSIAYGAAAMATERRRPAGWPGGVSPPEIALTIVGIVLLRWIPLQDLRIVRELVVMAGSIALLFAIPRRRDAAGPAGGTPAFLIAVLAVAVATPVRAGLMTFLPFAVALLVLGLRGLGVGHVRGSVGGEHRETARPRDRATAIPRNLAPRNLATFAVGAALLFCAFFARYSLATVYVAAAIVFLAPLIDRVRPLSYAAAVAVFALWPWSGIVARALPVVRNYTPPAGEIQLVPRALAAGESMPIAVPPHLRQATLTMSGGHFERFRAGRVIGTIEATDQRGHLTVRPIRIGDIADYGFMRREQFFASRNPLPRYSPGEIRGYGASAWLVGSGRVTIVCPSEIASLRVNAAANLHSESRLQVDSVEYPSR
jgi:hypothetical protein